MKKIDLAVLVILSCLTTQCVKKQFLPLEKPHSLFLINPNKTYPMLQEPLKEEMVEWSNAKVAEIPVEGFLRVTYKKQDYFFIQLNCPKELKCNGKKVYVPRNMTHATQGDTLPFNSEYKEPAQPDSNTRFVIAETSVAKNHIEARDWLHAPVKNTVPTVFDRFIFTASLPESDQLAAYGAYNLLAVSVTDGKFVEKTEPNFAKRFPVYASLAKKNEVSSEQRSFLTDLRRAVDKPYADLMKSQIEDFPFSNPTYAAMVNAFNAIKEPRMLKSELAARIQKDGRFLVKLPIDPAQPAAIAPGGAAIFAQTAEPTPMKIKSTANISTGLTMKFEGAGAPKDISIEEGELVAYAHEKGIAFQLGSDKSKATLIEPVEESVFLKSGNKKMITEFIKSLPADNEIVANYDLDLALLRLAMKYGKGEMNQKTHAFEYTVDLSKGKVFWAFLSAFKNYYGESSDDVYSGAIESRKMERGSDADVQKGQINWAQYYDKSKNLASMGIKGKAAFCQRMCHEVEVDATCFDNKSALKIIFRPAALTAENADKNAYFYNHPHTRVDFSASDAKAANTCNSFTKLADTSLGFE